VGAYMVLQVLPYPNNVVFYCIRQPINSLNQFLNSIGIDTQSPE